LSDERSPGLLIFDSFYICGLGDFFFRNAGTSGTHRQDLNASFY
jgi:hypothetical protein